MLVIIPARGGSKGVPRKNIRDLAGRPLIDYVIQSALGAEHVERVIVSTEDQEIAAVARSCGAEVPYLRPAELATDTAPNGLACLHIIEQLAKTDMLERDSFVLIQPTSPLIESADIDAVIDLFEKTNAVAVCSVMPFEYPVESVFELDSNHRLVSVLREIYSANVIPAAPRQAYGQRYRMSGAITGLRTAYMRDDVNYYYSNSEVLAYVLPEERGHDIDTLLDFVFAEFLVQRRRGTNFVDRG